MWLSYTGRLRKQTLLRDKTVTLKNHLRRVTLKVRKSNVNSTDLWKSFAQSYSRIQLLQTSLAFHCFYDLSVEVKVRFGK